MPVGAIYVGRPTKWGIPFKVGTRFTRTQVVEAYRHYIKAMIREKPTVYDLSKLRGKDLVCWCALGKDCHADVLLELSNPQSA
jgi:hypothetical protein